MLRDIKDVTHRPPPSRWAFCSRDKDAELREKSRISSPSCMEDINHENVSFFFVIVKAVLDGLRGEWP
jgi:hypothetical protein